MLTDSSWAGTTCSDIRYFGLQDDIQLWRVLRPGKSKPVALETVETALGYPAETVGAFLTTNIAAVATNPESSPEQVSNFDNLEVKPHAFAEGATLNKMAMQF